LKLKPVKKFDYWKEQIEQYIRIGSPIQTKLESTNPDPMKNNHINNHKIKTNTKSKSKNTIKKLEYVSKYVFRECDVTSRHRGSIIVTLEGVVGPNRV